LLKIVPSALIWEYNPNLVNAKDFFVFTQALSQLIENIPFLTKRIYVQNEGIFTDQQIDELERIRFNNEIDIKKLKIANQQNKQEHYTTVFKSISNDYPEVEQLILIFCDISNIEIKEHNLNYNLVIIEHEDLITKELKKIADKLFPYSNLLERPESWWQDS
jgi:hypothetical protein